MEEELVKMSPKGQLVVPQDIRLRENFKPSDRFVAFGVKDGVLFKKIDMPNVKAEFESLSKEIAKQFRKKIHIMYLIRLFQEKLSWLHLKNISRNFQKSWNILSLILAMFRKIGSKC